MIFWKKFNITMKDFWKKFKESMIFYVLVLLVVLSIIVVYLTYCINLKDGYGYPWKDILVEAHGLLFDLFFLGIIIYKFELRHNKKNEISKLISDIDIFRNIKVKVHQIAYKLIYYKNQGFLKEVDLSKCYLKKAQFKGKNLEGVIFSKAKLQGANFKKAILTNVKFNNAKLQNVDFSKAEMKGVDLTGAKLKGAIFPHPSNLKNVKFLDIELQDIYVLDNNWIDEMKKIVDSSHLEEYKVSKNIDGKNTCFIIEYK